MGEVGRERRLRRGREVAEAAAIEWLRINPGFPRPGAAHVLKTHPNSTVCRLDEAYPDGSAVVAKLAPPTAIAAERQLYSEVLPLLPVAVPEYRGSSDGPRGAWLFLSYVDGQPYDSSRAEHRRLAGRYVGLLHAASSHSRPAARLARRDAVFVKEQIEGARAAIQIGRSNGAVSQSGQDILREFQSRLDLLSACWERVREYLESMPHALVHGDFVSKNCGVRHSDGRPELVVMDWELAGWGPIATDLGWVDLDAYRSSLGDTWPELSEGALEDLSNCGRMLRTVVAPNWEAAELATSFVDKSLHRVRAYLGQLDACLAAAHWIE